MRSFWRGDKGTAPALGTRLAGSSDLYSRQQRGPYASINFVTAHDGFTLHDLVSYERKHNEANGENNRDGDNHNLSWNSGVEGPSVDPAITPSGGSASAACWRRCCFRKGVPMILGGDELGRTQDGNNNAYCHDSELTWLDWDLSEEQQDLLGFTRALIEFRADTPVLRRRHFFRGVAIDGAAEKDLAWYDTEGKELTGDAWQQPALRSFGFPHQRQVGGRPARGCTPEEPRHLVRAGQRNAARASFYVARPATSVGSASSTRPCREWDRRFALRGKVLSPCVRSAWQCCGCVSGATARLPKAV